MSAPPTAALSDFGLRVLANLLPKSDKNVFVSPVSIVAALGLALAGSTPDSAVQRELLQAIGVADEKTVVEGIVGPTMQLGVQLRSASSGGVEVRIANSVWVKEDIKPEYVTLAQQAFGAYAVGHISEPEINAWVEEATKGKIKNLVKDLNPETAAVLINAIYFRGSWKTAFDKEETRPEDFTLENGQTSKVQMMHLSADEYRFKEWGAFGSGGSAIALPYRGGEQSCVLVLPPEGVKIADYVARLASGEGGVTGGLLGIVGGLEERKVATSLPRLKIEFEDDLVPLLLDFGCNKSLNLSNEWSRMSDSPLGISAVLHKAILELDEEGTTAAAATAVVMTRSMPSRFKANRPFLLVLWDETLQVPLFVGAIRDPGTA